MRRNHRYSKPQRINDFGLNPAVVNIDKLSRQNENYRTALWTGDHLQVTLMSIIPGSDIGMEIHPDTDQFLRIEQGTGMVLMGDDPENPEIKERVNEEYAIMVPAGTWHNLINTGNIPLKLYTVYAPPEHPFGTVHPTKEIAIQEEDTY